MGMKSLNYQITISTIVGIVIFLMSANFAFGQAYDLDLITMNDSALKLIESGNYQEAIEILDEALEFDPDNIHALHNKGWALLGLDKPKEAIFWFDKAILIDLTYVHALNNKGNAFIELDRPEDALVFFDMVLRIDPNYIHAWNNKGFALSKLGRYDDAILHFNKALEINPNYTLAQQNLELAQQNTELAENAPTADSGGTGGTGGTADSGLEWFPLLILVPIVFGMFLIQHFRKKSTSKKEKWIEASAPKIASFVDPKKDPQRYLDRYYKEKKYKEWFDKNYPNLTIEEAIGL